VSKKEPPNKTNQIRFFCDRCGFEVAHDTKSCPSCGRSFSSVRCPACNFAGDVSFFENGCPVCGYSTPPPPSVKPAVPDKAQKAEQFVPERKPRTSLPLWIYILTGIALLSAGAALFFQLR
jgi:hypothetical protein